MLRHLAWLLGVDNASGGWYLFWSGIFADAALLAAPVVLLRKHNCHVHRCLRVGRHEVTDSKGQAHVVCRKHHPDGHLRAEHL